MDKRIEHDPAEARAWRQHTALAGIFYWLLLLTCAPTTFYLALLGVGEALNGIRDWWHYKERVPHPDAWIWVIAFFVAGIGWVYSYFSLADYKQTRRFNEFVRSRRINAKRFEEQLARPNTLWDKIFIAFGLVWWGLILIGFIIMIITEIF